MNRSMTISLLLAVLGLTALISLSLGRYPVTPGDLRRFLLPQSSHSAPAPDSRRLQLLKNIIVDIRMPRIAYVPQFHRITFGYRVLDAVLMGRLPHKPFFFRYGGEDEQVAVRALERLGIEHLKDRPYTEVSGGERQLVLIARALAQGADIFVMDEPVNGLDYGNQIRLLARIADLSRSGYTFIKTTHFPDHALWVSNRVVMLKEGCVVADGPAAKTINKATLYQLYNTRVDVVGLNGGGRICVPHALGRYGHRRPSGKHHEFSKRVRVAG